MTIKILSMNFLIKKYTSRDDAKTTGGGEYLKKAARLVYTYATKKLNDGLDKIDKTDTKVKFADYIIYGLSRDINTELVKFTGNGKVKTRLANREFRDILANSRFNARINASGDPKIEIYKSNTDGSKLSGNTNLIIQIRYKMEVSSNPQKTQYKFYPRNYLEAQPGMFLI